MDNIDAVAVCNGPGLTGSLIVGIMEAKMISFLYKKPLITIDHIDGHIASCNIAPLQLTYPVLALIISGGHTEIRYLENEDYYKIIGKTQDDAVGECFDKVARMLKLPYPGGPAIESLALKGIDSYELPYPLKDGSCNFSFSGLKSSIYNKINNGTDDINVANFCCSFQTKVAKILVDKMVIAANEYKIDNLLVTGGVSANSFIKQSFKSRFTNVNFPEKK